MQGGPGVDVLIVVALAVGIPLGVVAVTGRAGPHRGPTGAGDRPPPARTAATHPGTWLAAVVALVYLNQVLLTVYVTRVHGGDPAFVARYLPPQWFHVARGPVVDAVAAGFPAPHLLAPTVLRVQAFLELPLAILLYLLVAHWLDPGLYRRLGSGVLVGIGSLSVSGVFCLMERLLPSPWTAGDLWIRAASTVVTPWLVHRMVRAAPPGVPRGARRSLRGWLAFLVSAGALGVCVLVVYDTALLYNLAHVPAAAPVGLLALAALGVARLAAREPADGVAGADAGMDTLVTGMTWFLGVFYVPAMPVRYGLAVLPSGTAVPAAALMVLVAGLGALLEVGRRVRDGAAGGPGAVAVGGGAVAVGRGAVARWLARLAAAGVAGVLAAGAAATVSARYPETRILAAAVAFLLAATAACAVPFPTPRLPAPTARPPEVVRPD